MEVKRGGDMSQEPLTPEEQAFAVQHHHLVLEYLRIRRLPVDDWYDVVIFRYLRSVRRWHTELELHYYSFKTIAFKAMQSAIGGEYAKRSRRIDAISLEEPIPGTDGMTYGDTITYDNIRRML